MLYVESGRVNKSATYIHTYSIYIRYDVRKIGNGIDNSFLILISHTGGFSEIWNRPPRFPLIVGCTAWKAVVDSGFFDFRGR